MSLTVEVTKVSVTKKMDKLWYIVLKLVCLEDTEEVINYNFTIRYRMGDDIVNKVQEIKEKMQDYIDKYKGEQSIFNNAQLDTAVAWLESNLEG